MLTVVTLSTKNGGELVSISPIINAPENLTAIVASNDTNSMQNTTIEIVNNSIII